MRQNAYQNVQKQNTKVDALLAKNPEADSSYVQAVLNGDELP